MEPYFYDSWLWTALIIYYISTVLIAELVSVYYLTTQMNKLLYIPERDSKMGPYRNPDIKPRWVYILSFLIIPIFTAPFRTLFFAFTSQTIFISQLFFVGHNSKTPLPTWRRWIIRNNLWFMMRYCI
jgi:hypothetical protein